MKRVISKMKSPVGYLQIEAIGDFISEIKFLDSVPPDNTESEDSPVIKICKDEIHKYFNGKSKIFTVPLKPTGTEFEIRVWDELKKIPYGSTISYEELAVRLGDIHKIRAAGRANGKNPIPIMIPCHRVIGKDGSFTGYAGGLERKEWLLSHEGAIGKQVSLF